MEQEHPSSPDTLTLRLVEDDPTPLYLQIVQQLRQQIMTHQLPDGGRLPAVRKLAEQLSVNPGTVAQSYRELAAAGLVESVRGRGTVVRHLSTTADDLLHRDRQLDDCLLAAITRAQALGFDPSEIRHRLSALLAAEQVTVPVIFLGGTVAQAARYARDLDRRFAHRSLSFVPYDLSALSADSPSLLDTLRTAWTVVTFVTAVPTVQRFLSRHRIEAEIIGVTAELGAMSVAKLSGLAPDRRCAVVTESRVLTAVIAEIEQMSGLDRSQLEIHTARPDGRLDLSTERRLREGDETVIFSFGVHDQVMALDLDPDRLLELRFELTAAALDQLQGRWP